MQQRNQIDEIKQKLDIVQVVEKYVRDMKRSGPNYFGLCPFHNEKTPSFSVNQDLQIYKCFGCGEHGDVISFIQKIEGLEFPKALEMAANMAGIVLEKKYKPSVRTQRENVEKEKILEANKLAMQYFNYILIKHDKGKSARDYVKRRKIEQAQIEKFQIGYAPDGYNNLKNFLLKKKFRQSDLVNWGLLVSKNGKVYDKFRDRLMFPIFNHIGEVVGFSGRQLVKSDYGPKYLNSPETLVYKKKETLYGLYQAKEQIRKQGFVVLVEGNVDILSSHRVGTENIVCPLGTALTLEQCKLVRRYTDKVYFALDTDEAGEKAMIRGLALTQKAGLQAFALNLGKYQDSDELIMDKPDLWAKQVAKPYEIVDFFINKFEKQFKLDTVRGKAEYLRKLAPFVMGLEDKLERKEYARKISAIAQIDGKDALVSLEKYAKDDPKVKETPVSIPDQEMVAPKKEYKLTRQDYLAATLLQFPTDVKIIDGVGDYIDTWLLEVVKAIQAGGSLVDQVNSLPEDQQEKIEMLSMTELKGINPKNVRQTVESTLKLLQKTGKGKRLKELRLKIRSMEAKGEDASEYVETFNKLMKKS